MSLLYCFHKVNIFSNIIVLNPSTIFQTYDFISCDILCDCDHMSLYYPRKKKEKKKKLKLKIKSKKINKNKIKY